MKTGWSGINEVFQKEIMLDTRRFQEEENKEMDSCFTVAKKKTTVAKKRTTRAKGRSMEGVAKKGRGKVREER